MYIKKATKTKGKCLYNSPQSSIIIINIYVNNQQEDFKIICLGSPVKPGLTNVSNITLHLIFI